MPFKNCADPHQLAILTEALDQYCYGRGINSPDDRDEIAAQIITLFARGASRAEEIMAGLDQWRGKNHFAPSENKPNSTPSSG